MWAFYIDFESTNNFQLLKSLFGIHNSIFDGPIVQTVPPQLNLSLMSPKRCFLGPQNQFIKVNFEKMSIKTQKQYPYDDQDAKLQLGTSIIL